MSGGDLYEIRRWMYMHRGDDGSVTREYLEGLEVFMHQATNMPVTIESGKMFCPCRKCNNTRFILVENVWKHLLNRGFTPQYFIWFQHGEGYCGNVASTSRNYHHEPVTNDQYYDRTQVQFEYGNQPDRINDMVTHAFRPDNTVASSYDEQIVEEPNLDAKKFYDMLNAANQPIYDGCREGHSKLSLAARMMNIKTDHNLSEVCMDDWASLLKEYFPSDNLAAETFYEVQKLVISLGLPYQSIDVCIDNCMIFWKDDDILSGYLLLRLRLHLLRSTFL